MEDDKTRLSSQRIEVELRDLESLLREKLGTSLIVDSFTTSSLLPPGENYGSTMLRVDAKVKRDGLRDSEPEKLSFVAKMIPPTEFQRMVFESPVTFRKEIHMFRTIVPAYQALERECGLPEAEVFDPIPELWGSRLSLEADEEKFDEDAVILMENLKLKNYACGDRKVGVDLEHARSLVKSLARFHALGIAVKIRKLQLFKELESLAKRTRVNDGLIADLDRFLLSNVKKVPSLFPHLARIEKALPGCNSNYLLEAPIVEPWGTIIHTDLWVNNVMFRDDESGHPENVKLVDFQNYTYQNPLMDLVFFLFTSCNSEVRTTCIEELIDLYYTTFISHLARLKFDVNLFSRDSFNEQLAKAAKLEYSHCIFMLRPIIIDADTDPAASGDSGDMFKMDTTVEYRERIAEISLRFIKENWI